MIARGDTYQRVASPADRPDVPPALQPGTPWKDYIGEYGWEFDKLFVFEEGGQLRVLVEWFDFEPLERMTGDRFVLPDRGFYQAEQVVFARDPQGAVTGVTIGAVLFPKLSLAADGKSFRVKLVRPTGELRREAQRSRPPAEAAGLRSAKLVEVTPAAGVHLDVRYATSDNFMGAPLYGEPRVFLERGAALALRRVAERLQAAGYGLILYDGYRPWSVTKMMWDGTPEAQRLFVADPAKGSRHNRGCAVDLSLFDRKTGRAVTMPSGYDEMTERAYAFYPGGTERQRAARDVLRYAMEKEGFAVNPTEWWHFDYKDWATYAIGTVSLDDLRAKKGGVGPSR